MKVLGDDAGNGVGDEGDEGKGNEGEGNVAASRQRRSCRRQNRRAHFGCGGARRVAKPRPPHCDAALQAMSNTPSGNCCQ